MFIHSFIIWVAITVTFASCIFAAKWEMLPIELLTTYGYQDVLRIKSQIPIELIPSLQDIYDSFKVRYCFLHFFELLILLYES